MNPTYYIYYKFGTCNSNYSNQDIKYLIIILSLKVIKFKSKYDQCKHVSITHTSGVYDFIQVSI